MVRNEARFSTVRFPMAFRAVEVRRVERITPRMVRVTFGGDDLDGFESRSPGDHLKVIFPANPDEQPVLPRPAENGFAYPEGAPRPVMRDYTISSSTARVPPRPGPTRQKPGKSSASPVHAARIWFSTTSIGIC
jgi:NADPH-dependent ferric siderophore reductase